jgi:hypothetical protein
MVTYFILHEPNSERRMGDGSENIRNTSHVPCPITTDHFEGGRRMGPLFLQMKHNSREELIIWWLFGCVVHERLLDEFEQQGFTGYQVKPATVRFHDGSTSTEYREFIVTGWAGMASPESGIRLVEDCPACRFKRYSGITNVDKLIDWSQWTGDDFFFVWPRPSSKLVTERVAQWLLSHKVKSFRLIGFEDLSQFVEKFGSSPGRLSDYVSQDLVIKYGKPLGLE